MSQHTRGHTCLRQKPIREKRWGHFTTIHTQPPAFTAGLVGHEPPLCGCVSSDAQVEAFVSAAVGSSSSLGVLCEGGGWAPFWSVFWTTWKPLSLVARL
mmetsp:Transcript_12303/g.29466  ORF Transcript_12303/g.29466 Transcript_12303/m.29466 type:complete len:99 (-) Transcript_12303:1427-1723(-)